MRSSTRSWTTRLVRSGKDLEVKLDKKQDKKLEEKQDENQDEKQDEKLDDKINDFWTRSGGEIG